MDEERKMAHYVWIEHTCGKNGWIVKIAHYVFLFFS